MKEDGFIISNGRRRYNKKLKSVVGTAVSEVKNLKANFKPFVYYCGQWNRNVDPECIKNLVSGFASIIDLEELSKNIPNRYFRAYKITVESQYNDAMLTAKNWPAGITIRRWFERNDGKDKNTRKNLTVNYKTNNKNFTSQVGNVLTQERNNVKVIKASKLMDI